MLYRCLGFVISAIILVNANLDDWHISTICTKDGKAHHDSVIQTSTDSGGHDHGGSDIPKNGNESDAHSTEPGMKKRKKIPSGRTGVLWEQGIIPYYFNTDYYGSVAETLFEKAIAQIESASCLRFQKLTKVVLTSDFERNWLHIANEDGQRYCSHFDVNAQENNYEITTVLGYDCLKSHEILHTLLHGVGLADEITHPKRDRYVAILWDNIQPRFHKLFRKANNASYNMEVEYDPQSIMHFHDHAFTQHGRHTIIPLKPGVHIAPSQHLSQLDQVKLRVIGGTQCGQIAFGQVRQKCGIYSDIPPITNADSGQLSNSDESQVTKEDHSAKQTTEIGGTEEQTEGRITDGTTEETPDIKQETIAEIVTENLTKEETPDIKQETIADIVTETLHGP